MRNSVSRRVVAAAGFVAVVAATVTGCSSDSDSDTADTSTTSVAASKASGTSSAGTTAAAAADDATTQEITDVFVTFFNGTTPPADRAALVENGDVFLPTLEALTANPQATATTATVQGVEATGTNAAVKWTLLMNGAPVLPDQSGEAIEQAGEWKVSAATFCTLLAIQGGGAPVPGC
ncbi:hypothetical protein [Rhodococcus sp. 24CO]|uniref:hypothetical protein n=1 Tax=Rhodococcus sp. 24CO TaxID=3117460 RepID=UPI003D350DAD